MTEIDCGPVRTDLCCTECRRTFIAELDLGLDGNHVIECPYCGHEHCRVVQAGVVTDVRWDSRKPRIDVTVQHRSVWKADSRPARTSTASEFIRQAWLNKRDLQL